MAQNIANEKSMLLPIMAWYRQDEIIAIHDKKSDTLNSDDKFIDRSDIYIAWMKFQWTGMATAYVLSKVMLYENIY